MQVVPFHCQAYGGLADVEGIIRHDAEVLTIQFEIKGPIFGLFKSGIKKTRIPIAEITKLEAITEPLRGRIEIAVRDMNLVESFPGNKQGRIRLDLKSKDKEAAEQFAKELKQAVARGPK